MRGQLIFHRDWFDGYETHRVLNRIHEQKTKVELDQVTASHMDKAKWSENFEALRLPSPSNENLGDWVNALSGWVGELAGALSSLRASAMESLLDSEQLLEKAASGETPLEAAPAPPRLPSRYDVLIEGQERDLQTKLNFWDSFQTASGVGYTILRFSVAAVIVWGAVWLTLTDGSLLALRSTLGL